MFFKNIFKTFLVVNSWKATTTIDTINACHIENRTRPVNSSGLGTNEQTKERREAFKAFRPPRFLSANEKVLKLFFFHIWIFKRRGSGGGGSTRVVALLIAFNSGWNRTKCKFDNPIFEQDKTKNGWCYFLSFLAPYLHLKGLPIYSLFLSKKAVGK